MLDKVTRKRIDDLRDILVGKVPDPKSQVEQITTGLIYKFMYDMDQEAVKIGGKPSFFVGDSKKYSWNNLFDPKLSGEDKIILYRDAIESMYTNLSKNPLFREIFKNSSLPYKDSSILNMFLKEINEFHYSHSEKLGDAFEYLLSFMGSQGDAGQFRTPRHIIDFIVEIVNPRKNETILDPACGTAGFLISSYKHILKKNTGKKLGDKLTAVERKRVSNNLVGYDISPDMTRISLVNMYLHQFATPRIYEYDTLSSEDRWDEYYDVIIANPPFFSPKGGITPHQRFGVQSKRAEVLFVDYIMEHLKPNGRAGIIVPPGIIFNTSNTYKILRKRLIENFLIGVISLPKGVFQPYSDVKTSILILDKKMNQEIKSIFFIEVKNDGYSSGAQRIKIDKNDLPNVIKEFISFLAYPDASKFSISRNKLIKSSDFSLSINQSVRKSVVSKYELVPLNSVSLISVGNSAPQDKNMFKNGIYPFVRTSDVGKVGIGIINDTKDKLNKKGIEKLKIFKRNSILFPKSGASTLLNHRVILDMDAYVTSHLAVIKADNKKILDMFLFYILSQIDIVDLVDNLSYPSLNLAKIKDIKIPLPSIDIQKEIVKELKEYQKIIDRCRKSVENYQQKIQDGISKVWEE